MNIASLSKHSKELKLFLQQIPFEILSLNETIQTNLVCIQGYEIIGKDRNRRRGGRFVFLVKITIHILYKTIYFQMNLKQSALSKCYA